MPPSPSIHDNSDWANISTYRAGKGDPDDNIPLGSTQYFIAGLYNQRYMYLYLYFSSLLNMIILIKTIIQFII